MSNAKIRARICKDVDDSGYFSSFGWQSVDIEELYNQRHLEKYCGIFNRVFRPSILYNDYTMNSYIHRRFNLVDDSYSYMIKEFVFECPLEYSINDDRAPITYYVTKEFNVGPFKKSYVMPGRFLFVNLESELPVIYTSLILAEEPAYAHTMGSGFDVELCYLRLRKYFQPGGFFVVLIIHDQFFQALNINRTTFDRIFTVKENHKDPLCKLISGDEYDSDNQHNRFCVAISKALHFEKEVPRKFGFPSPCSEEEIAFKNSKATRRVYHERMTSCRSTDGEIIFYFSRSYLSNGAFVYRRDTEKIYLEALSTNLGIRDELNSLNTIEN